MIEWLTELWDKNKWLFFILLPLVILAWGVKAYMEYNKYKAEQDLKNTQSEDDRLKAEQDRLNAEANRLRDDADRLEDEINNGNGVDDNWHEE